MIQVVVSRGAEVLARAVFRGEAVTIGRDPDNAIQVDDPTFSRRHARIEPHGARWVLRDLGSTNGVLHAGERIDEWAINDGDEVEIGGYRLTFSLDEEEEADQALVPLAELLAEPATYAALGATFELGAGRDDQALRERSSNLRGYLAGDGAPALWLVETDAFLIGRHPEADFRTSGLFGPRVGAVIVRGVGGFTIVNMSGRAGWLKVDGKAVAHLAPLRGHEHLQAGRHRLRFLIGQPPRDAQVLGQRSRARRA